MQWKERSVWLNEKDYKAITRHSTKQSLRSRAIAKGDCHPTIYWNKRQFFLKDFNF